mmetsp:Transcript_35017/g.84750  ORF Transcript_35017/g.84750 Transcript_35017/m.84750 type:complete len:209 (+) Transcript_35017:1682-2308(+)
MSLVHSQSRHRNVQKSQRSRCHLDLTMGNHKRHMGASNCTLLQGKCMVRQFDTEKDIPLYLQRSLRNCSPRMDNMESWQMNFEIYQRNPACTLENCRPQRCGLMSEHPSLDKTTGSLRVQSQPHTHCYSQKPQSVMPLPCRVGHILDPPDSNTVGTYRKRRRHQIDLETRHDSDRHHHRSLESLFLSQTIPFPKQDTNLSFQRPTPVE